MTAGIAVAFPREPALPRDASLHAISSSRSLSDLVADYLIQQLVTGGLAQGQRVNEAEMARALGISRNPIREAVSGLHERGVLIAVPRRGSFVRRFTTLDVNELFSFRMSLERFTIAAAVDTARPADLARLADIVTDMTQTAKIGDVHAVRKGDMLFHAEIARISRNRHAINAFENLATDVLILMTIPHAQVISLKASAADHLPLLEALRLRSKPAARDAIDQHLRAAWDLMLRLYAHTADDRAPSVA